MRIPDAPNFVRQKSRSYKPKKLLTLGVVSHNGVERTVDFKKKAEATTPNSVFSFMHHYGLRLLYFHFGFVRHNALKAAQPTETTLDVPYRTPLVFRERRPHRSSARVKRRNGCRSGSNVRMARLQSWTAPSSATCNWIGCYRPSE
jgi:hypothetical protein